MSTLIYTTTFINETDLPIMVGAFIPVRNIEGCNKLEEVLIMPNEKTTIYSLTGEWFLSNHFDEQKYKDMWIEKGLYKIYCSGKFYNRPCINGGYSCVDTDIFNITYENNVFKFIYL